MSAAAAAEPRRLQVLFVSDVYFPRVNGVSTSIRTFRTDLADTGVDSVLVAPAYPSTADERDVVRVASAAVPGDPEDRRMHLRALHRALAQLRQQQFDLVHVQTPFLAHYAGVRFARRNGLPVVATYHTLFEEYLHHYVPLLPRPWGRALARRFTRSQCAQLDALIAPSDAMRALLLDYGVATRIEVIPTGLPPERYRPGNGPQFRARYGLPADRPLLLYVGRVAFEKNLEFLLQAFVAVRRLRADAMLAIAGEGPALVSLRALAQRLGIAAEVHFIGYLERERALADCYAAADVFVFASRTETQGLVLLEALAQGRPVVSTAQLGTTSVLSPDGGARIVPEQAELFAGAVVEVLADARLAARLSAQAQSHARGWASARMAVRLAALYRELDQQRTATATGTQRSAATAVAK
jgi:1,2-diacylglycerol 3-alpha-glucosyltransferase